MSTNRTALNPVDINVVSSACAPGVCTPDCSSTCLVARTETFNPAPQRPAIPRIGGQAHRVPAQPTPLLGRTDELWQARRALLRNDVRLLTLIGPPGVGKTRLAMGIADGMLEVFTAGVVVIELARIDDPTLVTATIAETLGVRETREHPLLPRLIDCLKGRSMLLILDNFEHVLPAADQVAVVLAMCPSIKILATSRSALHLRWEHVLPVTPLAVAAPDLDLATVAASPAVRLFVQRARSVDAGFELNADNASSVAELCSHLDGLPLAIELAAARIRLLSPKAMLSRLHHRLEMLVDGPWDLPARHRSLRKALDYGFDLLSADEQALFARLSLFVGGYTAEAACALGTEPGASPAHGFQTLDRIESLFHKSLIQHDPQPDGQVRFRMLETVRGYAFERLSASGELEAIRERWIEYHSALTERAGAALRGPTQGEWLALLDREHDNLRSVLRWCIENGDTARGLELAGSLGRFWCMRGHFTEGRAWLAEVLEMPQARTRTLLRARALGASGDLADNQGDDVAAEALHRESLSIYRELEERHGVAAALDSLGRLMQRHGDPARARELLEESLAITCELNDVWGQAAVQHDLGELATDQRHYSVARARYGASLVQWHGLGDMLSVASVFESMAILAQAQEHSERALRLVGASTALRERLRISCCAPATRRRLQHCLALAQDAVGPADAARAVEEGRAMLFDDAVTFARMLGESSSSSSSPAQMTAGMITSGPASGPLDILTPRERDVAALLLRGMSNRQIGEQLVITERTAETHVCRILSKLELGSRAQLASLIMDQELARRTGAESCASG